MVAPFVGVKRQRNYVDIVNSRNGYNGSDAIIKNIIHRSLGNGIGGNKIEI